MFSFALRVVRGILFACFGIVLTDKVNRFILVNCTSGLLFVIVMQPL